MKAHKAAIYIRWSTDEQGEGTTLEVQRESCLYYARSQGWEVPEHRIFIDDGYSGADLERPALSRLRELVRQGDVDCVILYKIDRLSRNIVDATHLVLKEWDGICHLKCVSEPIDTTTELGRMIFAILATFADFERATIRNRLFSGKVQRARQGRNPGIRLPFGYRRGERPGEVVVDPGQAAIVRRIFQSYAAGVGAQAIAAALNADGLTGYFGRPWSKGTIQKMLRNEAYTGRQIYGRSMTNRQRGADGPARVQREAPLVVREGGYPVIVPAALFERCRQIREERRLRLKGTSGRALSSPHLLSGLARCRCGHPLQAWHPSRGRAGSRVPVYRCQGRVSKGASFCSAGQISQPLLDELILAEVCRAVQADLGEAFRKRYRAALARQAADLEAQMEAARRRLAQLGEQEVRAYLDYRTAHIGPAVLERILSSIAAERSDADRGLAQLEARLAAVQRALEAPAGPLLDRLADWITWDLPVRKQMLRELVQELTVYRASGSREIELDMRVCLLADHLYGDVPSHK